MKKEIVEENKNILCQSMVSSSDYKGDLCVVLTKEKIIIKKKKGLFKKVYKEIDSILLKDIKIYNDEVQVKNNKGIVEIKYNTKNISFNFFDNVEAKKFTNKIIDILTGTSFVKRVSNKVKKVINTVDDVIGKEERKQLFSIIGSALVTYFFGKKK